ncbi:mechanosensitive ion channel family protein [Zavarzinia sp.]|uniref:mechanosensitive ion channel family protein n=1 Tax=Zavarzinia sp. TaxID=2027920 RepID=UPI00356B4241
MSAGAGLAEAIGALSPLVPDWLGALIVLSAAILLALGMHALMRRLLRRMARQEQPFLRSLLTRVDRPARFALIVGAIAMVSGDLALPSTLAELLGRALAICFVVLVGWAAMVALHIAGDLHLRRFRIDAEDNLLARKHTTQVRLLLRAMDTVIVLLTLSAALMTSETVRQYGVSLFASAGVAGIVAGFAARPVLANFFAGLQMALTQPIRVDDAVVIEGEWGWIEDITSTYVVVKLWDWRRLVVPLTWFMENPFQNWTRESANIIGSVFLHVDYTAPIEAIRAKLDEIARASPLWDGKVLVLQVTDATQTTVELRALVSAATSPRSWDLRCEVREKLLAFLNTEYPQCLPRLRLEERRSAPEVT